MGISPVFNMISIWNGDGEDLRVIGLKITCIELCDSSTRGERGGGFGRDYLDRDEILE